MNYKVDCLNASTTHGHGRLTLFSSAATRAYSFYGIMALNSLAALVMSF